MALMQQGMAVDQAVPPTMASMLEPQPLGGVAAPAVAPQEASQGTPYNGPMSYHGITQQVVNGVTEYEGKKFFVSSDGQVVWDESNRVLGSLDAQGNFIPATPELMQALQAQGLLETPSAVA